MTSLSRRIATTWVLVTTVFLVSGCAAIWVAGGAAAVGGSGAYAYVRGNYKAMLNAPLFEADKAVRQVSSRAGLIERRRQCSGYRAMYIYQDVHSTKVRVELKAITPETTRIYIRVGAFGDKASSQELLQAVDEQLQVGVQ